MATRLVKIMWPTPQSSVDWLCPSGQRYKIADWSTLPWPLALPDQCSIDLSLCYTMYSISDWFRNHLTVSAVC